MQNESEDQSKQGVRRMTISLPSEILEGGKSKAKDDQRSFSSYVAVLIKADLENAEVAK